jgi:hypothetical protein
LPILGREARPTSQGAIGDALKRPAIDTRKRDRQQQHQQQSQGQKRDPDGCQSQKGDQEMKAPTI